MTSKCIRSLSCWLAMLTVVLFGLPAHAQEFEPPSHPESHAAGKRLWAVWGRLDQLKPGADAFGESCMAVSKIFDTLLARHEFIQKQMLEELADEEAWLQVKAASQAYEQAGAQLAEQREKAPQSEQVWRDTGARLLEARALRQEKERALYLTEPGRDRARLEAFSYWLDDWGSAWRWSCRPAKDTWLNQESDQTIQRMISGVKDWGSFYIGWYEAFKASSAFAERERLFRTSILGDEDFGDPAAKARKRAELAQACRERAAAQKKAEEADEEWYDTPVDMRSCEELTRAVAQDNGVTRRLRLREQEATAHHQALAAVRDDRPKRNLSELLAYMDEVASVADQGAFLDPADQWNCPTPQHPGDRLLPRSEITRWQACLSRYMDGVLAYRSRIRERLKTEGGD
jgi:hypothetical protein